LLHEVSVTYGANKKEIVQGYIEQGPRYINSGNFHSLNRDYDLLGGDLDAAYSKLGDSLVYMQIDTGEDFTLYITFSVENGEPNEFAFEYCKITEDRTLNIISICKNSEYHIKIVYDYWVDMVNTYSSMPMNSFTGASGY